MGFGGGSLDDDLGLGYFVQTLSYGPLPQAAGVWSARLPLFITCARGTQISQSPLIREYALNRIRDPIEISGIFLQDLSAPRIPNRSLCKASRPL